MVSDANSLVVDSENCNTMPAHGLRLPPFFITHGTKMPPSFAESQIDWSVYENDPRGVLWFRRHTPKRPGTGEGGEDSRRRFDGGARRGQDSGPGAELRDLAFLPAPLRPFHQPCFLGHL